MKIHQFEWSSNSGWSPALSTQSKVQLLLVFGSPTLLKNKERIQALRSAFATACLFGCSTAGEILDTHVTDDTLVVTAIEWEHTRISAAHTTIHDSSESVAAGERLAKMLSPEDLTHVLVLSDGLKINGTDLVKGLTAHLPSGVTVTGGLSGDGARFQETLVFNEKGEAAPNTVSIIGLYGNHLKVGYASLGGWDAFGPERTVTRSDGSVLYELDGKSALELYKEYLGDHAKGLPAAALLFPLSMRTVEGATPVVRTILSVDEARSSMTFAGTMPQGAVARFMKANFDRLIDGASGAAKTSQETAGSRNPDFALLISCVGRKLILKQRIEEEVEGVRDVLGQKTVLTGFYSYGEISPFTPGAKCELHNQTMTITTFSER